MERGIREEVGLPEVDADLREAAHLCPDILERRRRDDREANEKDVGLGV